MKKKSESNYKMYNQDFNNNFGAQQEQFNDDDEYVYITDDEGDYLEDENGEIISLQEANSRGLISQVDESDRGLNFQNLSTKQMLLGAAAIAAAGLVAGGGAYVINKQLKKKKRVKKSELNGQQQAATNQQRGF
jgi:hypothetical protein